MGKRRVREKKKAVFGIRKQIIICFIVPILCVVLVGVFSYQRAQSGMQEKYTESTVQTLNAIVEYIDYGCKLIESEAFKYAYDTQLTQYYLGVYESDASKKASVFNTAKDSIRTSATVNTLINGIYIITSDKVDMLTSGTQSQQKGFLEKWKEQEPVAAGWYDGHLYVDEQLGLASEDAVLNYNCLSDGGKACVTIDIKQSEIKEILKKLDLGEDAVAAFVTSNGKEVMTDTGMAFDFYSQDFYQKAVENEESCGFEFVNMMDNSYLFLYSKSKPTGAVVCALVPQKTVVGQADEIRRFTWILVPVASLLALVLGLWISGRIQRNMKQMVREVEKVAKGNLTVSVPVKGKDEFTMLAESMNGMVCGTKTLVGKVEQASVQLEQSTGQVSGAAGEIGRYSRSLTEALSEIRTGMEAQTVSAGECQEKSNHLSEDIRMVHDEVDRVEQQIDRTEHLVEQSMIAMDELHDKSRMADERTHEVERSISALEEQISRIENFVSMINEISGETNLLSLNASIEAARAGEAGRGFSVVAEEIRALAEQSAQAANEIGKSVETIHKQMEQSVESTMAAGSIVREQSDSVREMRNMFVQMKADVEQMFEALGNIAKRVEHADVNRAETLQAVAVIAGVIEQTSASVGMVGDIAEKLMTHVGELDDLAENLDANMCELTNEVKRFQVK